MAKGDTKGFLHSPTRQILRHWRSWVGSMFARAMADNLAQMAETVDAEAAGRPAQMLDLGCWDAANSARYIPEQALLFGVEACAEAARRAADRGARVVRADLNRDLPWRDDSFDVVTSNQVIEHLTDTDTFVGECSRVLRPGGLLLISTENLSSWHNILALVLGWQAFSLTPVSRKKAGLGNPLASFRDAGGHEAGWEHMRIFSYRGLRELLVAHGMEEVRILGSGYYPLASRLAHADPRHGAFITAVGRKPRRK